MDMHFFVHLFHILIVGLLFLYVGIYYKNMPKTLFSVLFYLGIVIVVYHIYKAYNYMIAGKNYWVNLIHILIVGPLLIYIGFNKENVQRLYFEILMMLGFASIGYHGYYLVKSLK